MIEIVLDIWKIEIGLVVNRCYQSSNANGLSKSEKLFPGQGSRNDVTVVASSLTGEPLEEAGGESHFPFCFFNRFTLYSCHYRIIKHRFLNDSYEFLWHSIVFIEKPKEHLWNTKYVYQNYSSIFKILKYLNKNSVQTSSVLAHYMNTFKGIKIFGNQTSSNSIISL